MTATQELNYVEEHGIDLTKCTYRWRLKKTLTFVGCITIDGVMCNYYKSETGGFYYEPRKFR